MITFRLTGDRLLDARFAALSRASQGKIIRPALRAASNEFLTAARANVPVKTGALKRSLVVRSGKRSRRAIRVLVQTGAGFFTGPTYYGGFVEYGHRVGKRSLGMARRFVRGVHFVRRAYEQRRESAKARALAEIRAALLRVAAGGGA